ncbi:hypothetical protein NECHADRAFT_82652 [Paecilomyces variotii No. 5]|uniref:Alpha/beta hydrolase fold-3 domain-containing protein n=1 Tax=Byssochlamys spectabilis (strain No. 5 / NBRC 109023) TaxID=1356009 RepID=V5FSV7_BYSSN|nr:hypothetical protein NECHADRAFT_82652 [Paecilomyces variotii No. 5]
MALSLFQYVRLKAIVLVIRSVVRIATAFRFLLHPQPKYKNKQRLRIPSRESGRFIVADLYTPERNSNGSRADVKDDKRTPIIVNWHGSGFVIPSLGSDAPYCSLIANETGIPVLDTDYRKGPEHPFPAALEDVEDVLRWIITTQSSRFDARNIVLSGFSAGANLALVASSSLQQQLKQNLLSAAAATEQGFDIKATVAFYPVTNFTILPEAKVVPKPRYPISPAIGHVFDACYVPDSVADRSVMRNPLLSPSLADEGSFPDTVVIVTCEGDTLAPEANELAERLKGEGRRKVVNVQLEGVGHAFDKFTGGIERQRREEAYGLVVRVLREVFGA